MITGQGLPLLIIAIAGLLLPVVARRLYLPSMVVEILFGIFLVRIGFDSSLEGQWLPFLAHLGFLMLMFLAGLEIDFTALRQERLSRLLVYLAIFLGTLTIAYGASRLMGHGLFLALVLSTTSLALVLPILRELGISKSQFGQSALLCATLADFCTLLALTAFILYNDYGLSFRLVGPVPVFIMFAVALWGVRILSWWHPHTAQRILGGSDQSELGVRAAFALLFMFVGLSELVGLEPILGAFLGGCVLSAVFQNRGLLEEKMAGFAYGFLIPIFFIHVGMGFSLESFSDFSFLLLTAKLMLAAFLVKLIPALFLRFIGLSWRACLLEGILLSARLSLIVAATAIGTEKGLLSPELEPAILTIALVTASLVPILFRKLAVSWLPASGRQV